MEDDTTPDPRTRLSPVPPAAGETDAQRAGLTYVATDELPGYTRRRCGRGFAFYDPKGRCIREPELRQRLRSLAVPPAWREVWICPDAQGHILATGRDDAGRKQYIYHPRWNQIRQEARYHSLVEFGQALPRIRAAVDADLGGEPTALATMLALAVRLLDSTLIRIGNESYARDNGSRGITTLEKEHVRVDGGSVLLEFVGKSGIEQTVEIPDPELGELLEEALAKPSERVLAYAEDAVMRPLSAAQVNDYLNRVSGTHHTAKDFRTWGGTVIATSIFLEKGPAPASDRAKTRALIETLDLVAERLGNTRAVTRNHYIHPGVLDAYAEGRLEQLKRRRARLAGLSPDEQRTLGIIRALREPL
jgi:DNA topoisomerase I